MGIIYLEQMEMHVLRLTQSQNKGTPLIWYHIFLLTNDLANMYLMYVINVGIQSKYQTKI